jgi:phosphopantetheinyl transferase
MLGQSRVKTQESSVHQAGRAITRECKTFPSKSCETTKVPSTESNNMREQLILRDQISNMLQSLNWLWEIRKSRSGPPVIIWNNDYLFLILDTDIV